MTLKERAARLKTDVPAVLLALRRPDVPWSAKLLAALTVAYALTLRLIPPQALAECREQSQGMWENGKPKRWYYALPIALVWAIVLIVICKACKVF